MITKKYYEHRKFLNKKIERELLGYREIETLKKVSSLIDFNFPSNGKLIDLGCNDQHIKKATEESGLEYFGLDIDKCNFNSDKLPFENNSIDIAISLAVIEHIDNVDFYISQIKRVLKPGGLIYLSTPNFQICYKNFYNDPTHIKPYTPTSLEMLLAINEFRNINTFPGLRCKPNWFYKGKYRFLKAYWLLPFDGSNKYAPNFTKGRSSSVFALGIK